MDASSLQPYKIVTANIIINVISGLVIFKGNETEIGMLIIIENMESEYIHDDSAPAQLCFHVLSC